MCCSPFNGRLQPLGSSLVRNPLPPCPAPDGTAYAPSQGLQDPRDPTCFPAQWRDRPAGSAGCHLRILHNAIDAGQQRRLCGQRDGHGIDLSVLRRHCDTGRTGDMGALAGATTARAPARAVRSFHALAGMPRPEDFSCHHRAWPGSAAPPGNCNLPASGITGPATGQGSHGERVPCLLQQNSHAKLCTTRHAQSVGCVESVHIAGTFDLLATHRAVIRLGSIGPGCLQPGRADGLPWLETEEEPADSCRRALY